MATLSLCVIARDEEDNLPRMLQSVAGVVDEIVVVDTGSVDRTVEVARSFGARVVSQPFEDDFSSVRNRSLDEATSDWVLVLDADEVLDERAGAMIRAAIDDPGACGYQLTFENDRGDGRVQRCAIPRLFRNTPEVRFEYLIHEQVVGSLAAYSKRTGLTVTTLADAVVRHDGYLPSVYEARGKATRNRRLFERQITLYPDHIYSWYKFGDFLRGQGEDPRDALERAAALLRAADPEQARALSFSSEVFALLAVELHRRGDAAGAYARAAEGVERFGETPNLLYVLGHLQWKRGEVVESFRTYARLRRFDGVVLPNPPEPGVTGPVAYHGMARALTKMKRTRAARRCFEAAIALQHDNPAIRLDLARLLLSTNDVAAAVAEYRRALSIAPELTEVRLQLATILLHTGAPRDAEKELAAALDVGADPLWVGPRLGQARLAMGDLEGALLMFGETPDEPIAAAGIRLLAQLADGVGPERLELPADEDATWRLLLRFAGLIREERPAIPAR